MLGDHPNPRALVVSSGLAFSCRMLGEEIASVLSPVVMTRVDNAMNDHNCLGRRVKEM